MQRQFISHLQDTKNKIMKLLSIISAGILLFTTSCSSSKATAKTTTPLYETKWSLQKIQTDAGIQAVQTKAFIKFDEVKNSAGGNGSCNSFGSSITISGNEVTFKNIFSTKMYCEEVQKTEDAFFKQLEKVNRFEIKGNTLLLYSDKDLLLEFTAA
jgi:heat shock protein HslJ